MDEDGGVLGRLPRSRPGTRSEKREGQAERGKPARAPGAGGKAASTQGATPKAARTKNAAPKAGRTAKATPPDPTRTPRPEARAADPVGDVVRGAGQVAGAGFRMAGTLAQELLRRLPRR